MLLLIWHRNLLCLGLSDKLWSTCLLLVTTHRHKTHLELAQVGHLRTLLGCDNLDDFLDFMILKPVLLVLLLRFLWLASLVNELFILTRIFQLYL